MSEAGRRRPSRAPKARVRHARASRVRVRVTAALSVLALGAAVAVPVATAQGGAATIVRGAPAGAPVGAAADQIRAREWHLDVLRAEKAWKYSKGRGVTVAVLDTGVDKRHPDLIGRVVNGPDLTGGVRRPGTRYWGLHGTSMASIISGHGHGPGQSQGMMGVAPLSSVLSVRVTLENDDPMRRDDGQQSGGADRDAVAQGIRYAVDHGADIINMSLGGGRQYYNGTASQESAIKYALGKGVILIASAGNDGSTANRKNFPAAYPGVIAVGALDRRLRLWKDSNRRSHAAVCAPGVDIVSADASNGYVVGTGTSASSAMVAGVAALVRSRYPRLSPAEVRQSLLQGSPARPGHPTGSPTCRGTVDAVRTLIAAHKLNKTSSGPLETPPPTPAPKPAAESSDEGAGLLLPLVLGGGGLLVVLGLVLGWRQRRRPEDDGADTDAVPDYGLPSAPSVPREPAVFSPSVAAAPVGSPAYSGLSGTAGEPGEPAEEDARPEIAPVSVPLWQSTEVRPGPPIPDIPPADPSPFDAPPSDPLPVDAPPADPVNGSWDALSWDTADPSWDTEAAWDTEASSDLDQPTEASPKQPPIMPGELRPFDPGEFLADGRNGIGTNGHAFGNGHNGEHLNGTNGAGRNGFDLNGSGLNGSGFEGSAGHGDSASDDDEWEAFRRSSLDRADSADGSLTAPIPAVPDDDLPPPPAVRPGDEEPTGAFPAVPADEEPLFGPVQPPAGPGDSADPLAGWPGDEPRGRHSRRSPASDDEDYPPPWW